MRDLIQISYPHIYSKNMINHNQHRRNRSFVTQAKPSREKKQSKSIKKILKPTSGEQILQEAKQIYYSQSHLQQSVILFEQYLSLHPKHSESLYLCGVAYLHLNKSQEAIEKLLEVSQDYENKANALLLSAMALNKLGNVGKSLQTVNECIRQYSQFQEAICFRGKLYMNLSFFHKAQLDFKSVINMNDRPSFLSYNGLADCYRIQGKIQKALTFYHKALQQSRENASNTSHQQETQLKIAICLYQIEKYEQSHKAFEDLIKNNVQKSSELYYYLGQTQIHLKLREKGLLNMQYSLRLNTNKKIAKRAFKKLVQSYLEHFQFYETLNIIKLGQICKLNVQYWNKTIQAFMLVIKGQYQPAVAYLTDLVAQLKASQQSKKITKIKRQNSEEKSSVRKQFRYFDSNLSKKLMLSSPKNKDIYFSKDKIPRKIRHFSTKSVLKVNPKIESTRLNQNPPLYELKKEPQFKIKTQHLPQENLKEDKSQFIFTPKQKQFLYPFILQFKAYGEFFLNNFMKCLQTYEQYENYIKDIFGRDLDLTYNKLLCEGLLMAENDMQDEALVKYSTCVDIYYEKYSSIPPEPLLYKIILLTRLAICQIQQDQIINENNASYNQILESTLQMINNYKIAIGHHHLSYYFKSIVLLLLQRIEQSRDALEKTLKISQECSWKFLYMKGVLEMTLGNYYDAIKQFSAGLILQSKAELYLGRSISFLKLSEQEQIGHDDKAIKMLMRSVHMSNQLTKKQKQLENNGLKSDLLIQNCFEDLQKYIELQTNQEQISLWVSKILFANQAYDEAIRSITKINNQTPEVLSMIECIQIYQGQFQNGGNVGIIIKSAFDGQFLSKEEQTNLMNLNLIKNYNAQEYDYLTPQYQQWLIILHLYIKEDYQLMIKYLQKQIFSTKNGQIEMLLRYNVGILYLLTGQFNKSSNVFKGLLKYGQKYDLKKHVEKILSFDFIQDQCLEELKEEIGISTNKILSSYLPFKPIHIVNFYNQNIKIYVKIYIPFPTFSSPNLKLYIDHNFILEQLTSKIVQKKIEAPWIKKINNKNVQFTQKLEESLLQFQSRQNEEEIQKNERENEQERKNRYDSEEQEKD